MQVIYPARITHDSALWKVFIPDLGIQAEGKSLDRVIQKVQKMAQVLDEYPPSSLEKAVESGRGWFGVQVETDPNLVTVTHRVGGRPSMSLPDEFYQDLKSDMSNNSIAEKYHVSISTVQRRRKRMLSR